MTRLILACLMLIACVAPQADAFVSKLTPFGGVLTCHEFGAILVEYVYGKYTGAQISNEVQAVNGFTWSTEDTNDNNSFISLIDAQSGVPAKSLMAKRAENLCVLAEKNYSKVNTKNKFRTELGIPTQ